MRDRNERISVPDRRRKPILMKEITLKLQLTDNGDLRIFSEQIPWTWISDPDHTTALLGLLDAIERTDAWEKHATELCSCCGKPK